MQHGCEPFRESPLQAGFQTMINTETVRPLVFDISEIRERIYLFQRNRVERYRLSVRKHGLIQIGEYVEVR